MEITTKTTLLQPGQTIPTRDGDVIVDFPPEGMRVKAVWINGEMVTAGAINATNLTPNPQVLRLFVKQVESNE